MNRSLSILLSSFALLGPACSSTVQGTAPAPTEPCVAGTCEPDAVFKGSTVTSFLVADDKVYAAFAATCFIYAADKPVTSARLIATDACYATSLVHTSQGLFWTEAVPTEQTATISWLPSDATRPVSLTTPIGTKYASLVALDDEVYVGTPDGLARFDTTSAKLEPVVTQIKYPPVGLRSFDGAIYFHDGYDTIYRWIPGEPKAHALVEHAVVIDVYDDEGAQQKFQVDASGLYWIGSEGVAGEGHLFHAPLDGGEPEELFDALGIASGLAVDDDAVYWTEADNLFAPETTTLHRMPKAATTTSSIVAKLAGRVEGLQSTTEGLYIAASPSISDLDVDKLEFKRFAGSLLLMPRTRLEQR